MSERFPLRHVDDLRASWEKSPFPSVKFSSYFPVYAELFAHLRGSKCTFIETGVLDGGSLFMWREWLGPQARVIGIDLNPDASRWKEHGFEILIGDQGDRRFWQHAFRTIGEFDALLDDGGHQSFQQIVTVTEAIRFARKACVIAVEDTATSFMKDFSLHGKYSFLEYAKDSTDVLIGSLHGLSPDRFPPLLNKRVVDEFRNVYSIQFFNGIVAYHISPVGSRAPELMRNRPPNMASDFRYSGVNSAQVDWPNPFAEKTVVVKGGQPMGRMAFNRLRSSVPRPIKRLLRSMMRMR